MSQTRERTIDRTADCTIKAVKRLTGLTYTEAERIMRRSGYRPGEGATFPVTAGVLWELLQVKPVVHSTETGTMPTLADVRQQPGRWLVFLNDHGDRHAVAVVDGTVYNREGFADTCAVTMAADYGSGGAS